ncbi:MAG: potassium-transporting ATPase subunit KdpA [Isosphaerales bacterium]
MQTEVLLVDLSFLHPVWAIGLPIAGSLPLGWWMARVLDPPPERLGKGLDAAPLALLRLLGHREPARMDWKQYAFALLAFNVALFVLSFVILLAQSHLPLLNPDGKGPLDALGYKDTAGTEHREADSAVIFNTVCSFVTNTNLQHYSGEQHLSYFSQLGAIVWLQFVTPACGLAVMLAVVRGLRGQRELGDFYLDTIRGLLFVLVPLSIIVAVLLVATGVPMTLHGAARASTVERGTQEIAVGPVAAEVAIKQLGTNGGGYFGPNSTHPFENPSPWSNLIEVVSIIIIPMASIVMFGRMIKDRAHAVVIYGVMMVLLLAGVAVAIHAETQPSAATAGLAIQRGGNLEGKEVRIGPVASATWSAVTTATSNGSVNAMHDSFQPLGGLVPMALMMLNVDFSGIGAGFLNMLMYVIVAVFLAGLMVGRTPEYLGKKIEAREVKLAMLAVLIHPLLITCGTALFSATDWGPKTTANPGPHGFSEVLYEFTSASANNGSGFEGLSDNNPAWNIATGVVLLLGRYPALLLPIAIAGFLAPKKRVPATSGTLLTNDLTFALMLLGTVLLVGALSFMPACVLGPIADHLTK